MNIGEKYYVRPSKGFHLFNDAANKPTSVYGYKIDTTTNKAVTTPHYIIPLGEIYEETKTTTLDSGESYTTKFHLIKVFLDDDRTTQYAMCIDDIQFLKVP